MDIYENKKTVLIIIVASIIFAAIVVLLYFLDTSMPWNSLKIVSCIIACFWALLIIPAFRYDFIKLNNMTFEDAFRAGVYIGLCGILLPFLVAPYFGFKYYRKLHIKK